MLYSSLIRTNRRTLAIQIDTHGELIVRAPLRMPLSLIDEFINKKLHWIEKHQKSQKERAAKIANKTYNEQEIQNMKNDLSLYLTERVGSLWKSTKLPKYQTIKITKSHKRWGSCSGKNRLCFSYRLFPYIAINPRFIDAIIYHELAHLKEKNHSKRFWTIVYSLMPEYEEIIKNAEHL